MDEDRRRGLHEGLSLRHVVVAAAAAASAAVVGAFPSAHAVRAQPIAGMAPNLTGTMEQRRYLIGLWTCTLTIPAAAGSPSTSEAVALGFSVAPGDTLQATARGRDFNAAAFYGYDSASKKWWISAVDSTGARVDESSTNGTSFVGTMVTLDGKKTIRETYAKVSDSRFRSVTEMRDGSTWKESADHDCSKS